MEANSFGQAFKITTFGESHGPAIGVVIDGCPAGVKFDLDFIQAECNRRRPGLNAIVSARDEKDKVEVLSGVCLDKTLGTPITLLTRNENTKPDDYKEITQNPRLGHADKVWKLKYAYTDPRGGGRSSGRETLARVMAGAVAKLFLKQAMSSSFEIHSTILSIGPHQVHESYPELSEGAQKILLDAKEQGESFGAKIKIVVNHLPAGLGSPVFHKLKSELGSALLSIGAVVGVEFGSGFFAASSLGTEFHQSQNLKNYGGIQGGISNGEPIEINIAFKPTSSILDIAKKGRHDPCIGLRGSVVAESMVALVLADQWLLKRLDNV